MKTISFLLISGILLSTAIGCENDKSSQEPIEQSSPDQSKAKSSVAPPEGFFTGRIIKITCGGAPLEFLNTDSIGEDWFDFTSDTSNYPKYSHCVNALNVTQMEYDAEDTLFFHFQILDYSKGDFYPGNLCLIGGLPKINVVLSDVIKKTKSHD